jgi:hypothetical protein
MGGYICDSCRKIILLPTDELYGAVIKLIDKGFTVAIFCEECKTLPIEHLLKIQRKENINENA